MHERAASFRAEAEDRYGFEVEVHEFPEGTKTAADAADVVGCDVAQIASSLVFIADGDPVVAVTSGANRVDEARLAALVGADAARMADPEEVRAATGYSIGGVPPFCHDGDGGPPVYVDETLLDHGTVWAAAGTPETVFPIDPESLVEFSDGTPADVTG
jgi:prolyl-tRNA editing enzyme YbaK/EbsC (Cys-tRNA(Pro) deacylase)